MSFIDWVIIVIFTAVVVGITSTTKKYTKSVADFLSANRTAGRYLLAVSEGMAGLGAIALIAGFEAYYRGGFVLVWWSWMTFPVVAILTLSGFVVYRFRQTRALTLAQFLEARYSKKFRIFAGSICFISGIVNFGIFPGISARFLVYFCGLPEYIQLFGFSVATFIVLMIMLVALSVLIVFWGGQIAVMVSDFVQGAFCNVTFVIVLAVLLYKIDWGTISGALLVSTPGNSMINPHDSGKIQNFNVWYYIIAMVAMVYNWMGWQGVQAYNCSAKNAHEAKMGKILAPLRGISQQLLLVFLPICAFAVMSSTKYAPIAESVRSSLSHIDNSKVELQMITPSVVSKFLPVGLMGMFASVILAAFISSHSTYLHSWASILIQDVVAPLQKKQLEPRQHMSLLRLSVIGIAVFICIFSAIYNQTQHIWMFWAITSAIYLGGAGIVVIGGLYSRKGTTLAAYSAMITGTVVALVGFVINQMVEDFFIDGQWFYLISILSATLSYIIVSVFTYNKDYNLNTLFHGETHPKDERSAASIEPEQTSRFLRNIGITREFSRGDLLIYIGAFCWAMLFFVIFAVGTIYGAVVNISSEKWGLFWKSYVVFSFVVGIITTIWFLLGGLRDMSRMFADLKTAQRDNLDDGTVYHEEKNAQEVTEKL
jgi:SSS family solute:Na+ symporter